MRASSAELVIIEVLSKEHVHMTSSQVYEAIRGQLPAVNPSTVYRALERLAKAGKVSISDMGTGSAVYELVRDEEHHHLVCQNCGKVFTIEHDEVEGFFSSIEKNHHFQVTTNHLTLFGLCEACREKAGQTK